MLSQAVFLAVRSGFLLLKAHFIGWSEDSVSLGTVSVDQKRHQDERPARPEGQYLL
jgi:hypothetical protein